MPDLNQAKISEIELKSDGTQLGSEGTDCSSKLAEEAFHEMKQGSARLKSSGSDGNSNGDKAFGTDLTAAMAGKLEFDPEPDNRFLRSGDKVKVRNGTADIELTNGNRLMVSAERARHDDPSRPDRTRIVYTTDRGTEVEVIGGSHTIKKVAAHESVAVLPDGMLLIKNQRGASDIVLQMTPDGLTIRSGKDSDNKKQWIQISKDGTKIQLDTQVGQPHFAEPYWKVRDVINNPRAPELNPLHTPLRS